MQERKFMNRKRTEGSEKDYKLQRQEREDEEKLRVIEQWVPKTELGRRVKKGEIKNIDEILDKYKILESEIVDSLIKLDSDLLSIGQSKGKFGGGKRRAWKQTQRKTEEGNVPTFSCLVVVGDRKGHLGLGVGKGKETLPAREKALRKAKLAIKTVIRGCGSFNCTCHEPHSIPFKVEGKCGSSKVVISPAPQGTGLVTGDQCKKILDLAGITDVYIKTYGQTRTTLNVAKACIKALEKIKEISGKGVKKNDSNN